MFFLKFEASFCILNMLLFFCLILIFLKCLFWLYIDFGRSWYINKWCFTVMWFCDLCNMVLVWACDVDVFKMYINCKWWLGIVVSLTCLANVTWIGILSWCHCCCTAGDKSEECYFSSTEDFCPTLLIACLRLRKYLNFGKCLSPILKILRL